MFNKNMNKKYTFKIPTLTPVNKLLVKGIIISIKKDGTASVISSKSIYFNTPIINTPATIKVVAVADEGIRVKKRE